MAASGIHQISLRDDRFDRLLIAQDVIRLKVKEAEEKGVNLTISDIEKFFTIPVGKIFKPHVGFSQQYVKATSGGNVTDLTTSSKTVKFVLNETGGFTSDLVLHATFFPITASGSLYYRYCNFPGLRLVESAEFSTKDKRIDYYTMMDAVFHRDFDVPADSLPAFDRAVGQQQVKAGTAANYSEITDEHRFAEGMQTYKTAHEKYEVFVPLMFWFCLDPAYALPDNFIGAGERTVELEIAAVGDIIKAYNRTADTTVEGTEDFEIGYTEAAAGSQLDRHRCDIALYANKILLENDTLMEMMKSSMKMWVIRVHKQDQATINTSPGFIDLKFLKFPITQLRWMFRLKTNKDSFDRWYLGGQKKVRSADKEVWKATVDTNAGGAVATTAPALQAIRVVETESLDSVVTRTRLLFQGIEILPWMPEAFYSSYIPFKYPWRKRMRAPTDANKCAFSWELFPGMTEMSGHVNTIAGEKTMEYEAPIASVSEIEFVAQAMAYQILIRGGAGSDLVQMYKF